jgi:hypothetical protein
MNESIRNGLVGFTVRSLARSVLKRALECGDGLRHGATNGGRVDDRDEHHEFVDGLVVAHGRDADASLATAKLRAQGRLRYWTIGPDTVGDLFCRTCV